MTAQLNIDEIYHRIDRLTQIAKQSSLREDFKAQQELLSSPAESSKDATLPCIMLPPASTSIYNRDSFTDQIDRYLFPPSRKPTFRSIILHGIGGVGKSHVALKYAHLKTASHSLDAVLWFHSETRDKLSQSFTDAALALGLAGVAVDRPKENRVHLLNWLQRTGKGLLSSLTNPQISPVSLIAFWKVMSDTAQRLRMASHFRQRRGSGCAAAVLASGMQ